MGPTVYTQDPILLTGSDEVSRSFHKSFNHISWSPMDLHQRLSYPLTDQLITVLPLTCQDQNISTCLDRGEIVRTLEDPGQQSPAFDARVKH